MALRHQSSPGRPPRPGLWLEATPTSHVQHREDLCHHPLRVMDDVVVTEPERQIAADDGRIVPPPVLLDLPRLQMRFTIRLNNEAVLDQEVHLPHAWNLDMPPHLQTGPAEPGVGENFQQRISPRND